MSFLPVVSTRVLRRRLLAAFALAAAFVPSACEPPPPEFCRNGQDDDRDGDIDCEDADCLTRVQCRGAFLLPEQATETFTWMRGDTATRMAESWRGDLDGDDLADFGLNVVSHQDSEVRVYLSSQRDGSGTYDFEDSALGFTIPLNSMMNPSATTDCDVDGDGLEDLVAVDTYGAFLDFWPPAAPMLRIVRGSPGLASEPDIAVQIILLPTEASFAAEVVCVGDVDGDGGGDLVLTAIDQPIRLLPSERLATASTLEQAQSRQWSLDVDRVESAGDLDGDGFDDMLLFGESWGSDELDEMETWGLFAVLPGSSDLGSPREGLTSIDDEARALVRIDAEARPTDAVLAGYDFRPNLRPAAFFADLDGDGEVELLAKMPVDRTCEIFDAAEVLRLDGDVMLTVSDVRGGLWGYDPADPELLWYSSGVFEIGDIDGDGYVDLIGQSAFVVPSGTVDEAYASDEEGWDGWLKGVSIWFGDGTIESFDRLPDEMDAMIVWAPNPQMTATRDGAEGLDIALMGGISVGVIAGRLAVEAAGR